MFIYLFVYFFSSWTISRDPCGHRPTAECAIVQKRLSLCLPTRFRPADKSVTCPRINPYTFRESTRYLSLCVTKIKFSKNYHYRFVTEGFEKVTFPGCKETQYGPFFCCK